MTATAAESVCALLADLHAWRLVNMPPENLAANVGQREWLVKHADRSGFVKAGDLMPTFTMTEVDGGEVTLDRLLANGPAVVIFFRFGGCPACNVAMPYYQRQLYPALKAMGAPLLAISPEVPKLLVDIKRRHGFGFDVACDFGNELARKLGITYECDDASHRYYRRKNVDIGELAGTGRWELPMPTVLVIDGDRRVRFAEVSPDWMVRTEAEVVIDAVKQAMLARAW